MVNEQQQVPQSGKQQAAPEQVAAKPSGNPEMVKLLEGRTGAEAVDALSASMSARGTEQINAAIRGLQNLVSKAPEPQSPEKKLG
ncbi:hypothetical protein COV82_01235 [Candidatus Peregrinibacteria bacterium CG11_big_fil_rev_8_21_14_0_20_46_8]|nr:MAG: hypothetical protein COV82_01235 [Candidatus Peregrinibacteria bacterium CG11_big_fil_rev_8_21_14_0_20_46_8]